MESTDVRRVGEPVKVAVVERGEWIVGGTNGNGGSPRFSGDQLFLGQPRAKPLGCHCHDTITDPI